MLSLPLRLGFFGVGALLAKEVFRFCVHILFLFILGRSGSEPVYCHAWAGGGCKNYRFAFLRSATGVMRRYGHSDKYVYGYSDRDR